MSFTSFLNSRKRNRAISCSCSAWRTIPHGTQAFMNSAKNVDNHPDTAQQKNLAVHQIKIGFSCKWFTGISQDAVRLIFAMDKTNVWQPRRASRDSLEAACRREFKATSRVEMFSLWRNRITIPLTCQSSSCSVNLKKRAFQKTKV